jgi:ketosteroid isomerase-like protein
MAGQAGRDKALASLVEAERAFSRTSEEKGVREAFLAFLAEGAVVFRPAPAEGRPAYEKLDPAYPALLAWTPEFAEVASSGELGYTTGPYRNAPGRGAEPDRFGHYVSIWKKQADGAWKVVLDIGIQHDAPPPPPAKPAGPAVAGPEAQAAFPSLSPEALRDEERAFGERAGLFETEIAVRGSRGALAAFGTQDVRVYRPGRFPSVGKRALRALVPADAGRISPGTERRNAAFHVGISWSGDLAYNYGTFESRRGGKTAGTTAYLRIWRKEASGDWKVSLDIELPVPQEPAKSG